MSADGAPRPAGQRPEAALAIIRIAMLTGVLMFGAVIWALQRAAAPAPPGDGVRALGRAMPVVFGVAIAALIALRVAAARRDALRARQLTIVGWAVGELAALAGGAYFMLARDPQWYVAGVLVLVAAYVVLPINRTRG